MSWVVTGIALLIPLATWLHSLGDPIAYLRDTLPPGQGLYVISKVLGLYALVAMTLQLLLGIRMASGGERAPSQRFNDHRLLAVICLLLILSHAGLFVSAASVRTHHFARDYVIPTLSHGFYRAMVSIGIAAFALLLVATLGRAFRRRAIRMSDWIHRLAMVAYVLVFVHSLAIGSESRMGIMPALYAALAAVVLLNLIRRMRVRRSPPPLKASAPLTSTASR